VEYQKVKSVAKQIEYKGEKLDKIILDTMHKIASVVGATLGPGGNPILIERFEHDLAPIVTKDGVTVFRAVGYENSIAQIIMESARDAALKTASDAGDGTTTATILAESIIRRIKEYCTNNPRVSPQKVMRHLDSVFTDIIEPKVKKLSNKIKLDKNGKKKLKAVAKLSANGDDKLADAVMECFEVTGDDGNVTITEHSGPSKYVVEQIDGYPIGMGYERTAKNFWPQFINDPANQRCTLEDPVFILYHGKLTEIQTVGPLLEAIGISASPSNTPPGEKPFSHNVVIVATAFSDSVLGALAASFPDPRTLNVIPLLTPTTIQQGSEFEFLKDVAAITGATVFDPLTNKISGAKLEDLGSNIELFECGRYRSNIIGVSSEQLLLKRVDEVKVQKDNSVSELDLLINKERLAKLVGGIAKLQVYGSSNGETKEKRDRAEDAICAVRGALKHGCLPGGAWTLLNVAESLPTDDMTDILHKALYEPFERLMTNCGIVDNDERMSITTEMLAQLGNKSPIVYDFLEQKFVDAFKSGILDSTPAVLEAIRNSLSIASRLGTLGGVIVQYRDKELERKESMATSSFNRMAADENPANERP
ncbi:MAG TPA: TCP-1/cpn60 chaperonin family protein, partial [Legionellaceae bacterium]|nr:TCP-1/cpn60 chaperonin family protein [Legionellaceae bacterium]